MTQQRIRLDWTIDEVAYLEQVKQVNRAIRPKSLEKLAAAELHVVTYSVRILILLLASSMLLTGRPPNQPVPEGERVHKGIAITLAQEEDAWVANDSELFDKLVDAQIGTDVRQQWRYNWQSSQDIDASYAATLLNIELLDAKPLTHASVAAPSDTHLVSAQVRFDRPSGHWWLSSPYRETRFYRESPSGWIRTTPALDYWGVRDTKEMAHLQFEFRERDADIIETIAPQIERNYVTLYERLLLELPQPDEKLVIALMPIEARRRETSGRRIELTSPKLSLVPATMSDSDYIAHFVMSRLTYRVVNEALSYHRTGAQYQWENMIWGLTGWLRTDILGRRAPWHEQAEQIFRNRYDEKFPLSLSDITTSTNFLQPNQADLMWHYAATESLIAYAVETYGQDKLPMLLQAFSDHASWNSLIRNLFELEAAEFEQNWNLYIRESYLSSSAQP